MKMRDVVKIYLAYKREMGMKFVTEERAESVLPLF
jgi:hypothetical protein